MLVSWTQMNCPCFQNQGEKHVALHKIQVYSVTGPCVSFQAVLQDTEGEGRQILQGKQHCKCVMLDLVKLK